MLVLLVCVKYNNNAFWQNILPIRILGIDGSGVCGFVLVLFGLPWHKLSCHLLCCVLLKVKVEHCQFRGPNETDISSCDTKQPTSFIGKTVTIYDFNYCILFLTILNTFTLHPAIDTYTKSCWGYKHNKAIGLISIGVPCQLQTETMHNNIKTNIDFFIGFLKYSTLNYLHSGTSFFDLNEFLLSTLWCCCWLPPHASLWPIPNILPLSVTDRYSTLFITTTTRQWTEDGVQDVKTCLRSQGHRPSPWRYQK